MDRVDREIQDHGEAVRDGMERARRMGKHVGRPEVDVDLAEVGRLWSDGHSLKSIARVTGKSRSTIRRRLVGLGMWPSGGAL